MNPLDGIAQGVYNELELMSNVCAANLGQHVHDGKPGARLLADGETPVPSTAAQSFRRRYNGCHNDATRRLVIMEGLAEVKALRYARHPSVDCQTLEGRLTVGRDTRPAKVVAYSYGYSLGHVYRLRDEARRYDDRHGLRRAA